MYRICKRFDFEAAHQLTHLGSEHPCYRLHGHSYKAWFYFQSKELTNGFVIDFNELDYIKDKINRSLDHEFLNDVIEVPTCEKIASYLYYEFRCFYPTLYKVRVSETDKTWGEYEGS